MAENERKVPGEQVGRGRGVPPGFEPYVESMNISSQENRGSPGETRMDVLIDEFIKSRMQRVLVLMRGAPGSGKSYAAEMIRNTLGLGVILSTDDYFVVRGMYNFDHTKLPDAHCWNQKRALTAMKRDEKLIIVDNTNIRVWEMLPYAKLAVSYGYAIKIIEPATYWKNNVKVLVQKGVHNVPKEKIANMLSNFEAITEAQLLRMVEKSSGSRQVTGRDVVQIGVSAHSKAQVLDFPKVQPSGCPSRQKDGMDNNDRPNICWNTRNDSPERPAPLRKENDKEAGMESSQGDMDSEKNFEMHKFELDDTKDKDEKNSLKNLEQLYQLFPNVDKASLTDMFLYCGQNLVYCVDMLLEDENGLLRKESSPGPVTIRSRFLDGAPDEGNNEMEKVDPEKEKGNEACWENAILTEDNELEDLFIPIDGEDWFDLTLPKEFYVSLAQAYASLEEFHIVNRNPSILNIRIPPKLAFELFRYLELNAKQHVMAEKVDKLTTRHHSEDPAAVSNRLMRENMVSTLNEMDELQIAEVPDLNRIMALEAKMAAWEAKRAEIRKGESLTIAQNLALSKLKGQFPKLDGDLIAEVYSFCHYDYEMSLDSLMSEFNPYFIPVKSNPTPLCIEPKVKPPQEDKASSNVMKMNKFERLEQGHSHRQLSEAWKQMQSDSLQKMKASSDPHVSQFYRNEAEEQKKRALEHRREANEEFFKAHNFKQKMNVLDLHMLTAKEAKEKAVMYLRQQKEILEQKDLKKLSLRIITGVGGHSIRPVLTPMVRNLLKGQHLSFYEGIGYFDVTLVCKDRKYTRWS